MGVAHGRLLVLVVDWLISSSVCACVSGLVWCTSIFESIHNRKSLYEGKLVKSVEMSEFPQSGLSCKVHLHLMKANMLK